MDLKPIYTVELKDRDYRNYSSREFPMCDLLETFGPIFKFLAPGHELYDAKNVNKLLTKVASTNPIAVDMGAQIRSFHYQKLKADDATVYRVSKIEAKQSVNIKSYLTTAQNLAPHKIDPLNIEDVERLFQLISQKAIIYIHNAGHKCNQHLDDGVIFHNPSAIRNPLALLRECTDPPEISQYWIYVGKRYTNSFLHTDDFGLPVINTMLNDGQKFWLTVDPSDNVKLIQRLRQMSGLDRSCPYNYLDTKVLIPPATLRQWGIKFYTTIQRQYETVVLGENVFHQCINLDLSVNCGANFLSWGRLKKNSTVYCKCRKEAKLRHDEGVEINGFELLATWRTRNLQ
ncbi:uncharacterized protein LOC119078685 [Bradysia coprophila]|uniref:uncharacterized protein LOC119078685 n=1 Tax=Bradysia coprophila TaxID=38358 RepID=UPI00187D80FF|nr:uncharacterized protein LOC119078685 [Bradysia coprophila]